MLELGPRGTEPLNAFISKRFFHLREEWAAFSLSERDFRLLERLRTDGMAVSRKNLLSLVRDYAEANLEETRQINDADHAISAALLSGSEFGSRLERRFTGPARQSLFAIKHACASQPIAADVIQDTLLKLFPKQSWVMTDLSYPLAYRFVAQPGVEALESFLGYLLPYPEQSVERMVILHILHDEACGRSNLAFRVYVAMMGHPHDACETVLDDIERVLACGENPSTDERDLLDFLADECRSSRASRIRDLILNGITVEESVVDSVLVDKLDVAPEDAVILTRLLAGETSDAPADDDAPLAILLRMLEADFPRRQDFVRITAIQSNWSFTEGGRLLGALLRSLYMVDRAPTDLECEAIMRLTAVSEGATPYMLSGPSGIEAVRRAERAGYGSGGFLEQALISTATWLESRPIVSERLWIHSLQWRLRTLQEEGRISDWISLVHAEAPYRPSYLTGVDWRWAEQVIGINRLADFMSPAGAYALLLMEMEFASDTSRFDIVLEILLDMTGPEDVVDQLIESYGDVALGVVRRFLTPANLMFNGLADDRLTALEIRVEALERCMLNSGGAHLSEEVYRSELNALTAELLLSNLNSGMFEIPWATFKRDSLESFEDLHKAYASLRPALESRRELSETTSSPASFPNGRSESYRIRTVEAPLFQIIVGLVSDFFEHTAFGLEVILSGRFRHNNLQEELWAAMPESPRMQIQLVPPGLQNAAITLYRSPMETVLEGWTAARLHTVRREKPDALFDIVPNQDEMNQLLDATREANDLEGIIDIVIEWLRSKLRDQVASAGEVFATELPPRIGAAFEEVRKVGDFGDLTEGERERIHRAVCEAAQRRIEELRGWFDGVDSVSVGAANLEQLAAAAAQRVRQAASARDFTVRMTDKARMVGFTPEQVKIAFDMLREIFSNAVTHGRKTRPALSIRRVGERQGRGLYLFSNRSNGRRGKERRVRFREGAYDSIFDAIAKEGRSGRPKIAAICSTLVEEETEIVSIFRPGFHHLLVELPENDHANA